MAEKIHHAFIAPGQVAVTSTPEVMASDVTVNAFLVSLGTPNYKYIGKEKNNKSITHVYSYSD